MCDSRRAWKPCGARGQRPRLPAMNTNADTASRAPAPRPPAHALVRSRSESNPHSAGCCTLPYPWRGKLTSERVVGTIRWVRRPDRGHGNADAPVIAVGEARRSGARSFLPGAHGVCLNRVVTQAQGSRGDLNVATTFVGTRLPGVVFFFDKPWSSSSVRNETCTPPC
jgi:hypothetical protein